MRDTREGQLQEQQVALLELIREEPSTASVIEALQRLYGKMPAAMAPPGTSTTFGTGTNFSN